MHSESEPSFVKREVTKWLSSKRLSRAVVAFASARWTDGGSGAVYVLLYRSHYRQNLDRRTRAARVRR
jgi:DNA-nicking Smr family endonuclease